MTRRQDVKQLNELVGILLLFLLSREIISCIIMLSTCLPGLEKANSLEVDRAGEPDLGLTDGGLVRGVLRQNRNRGGCGLLFNENPGTSSLPTYNGTWHCQCRLIIVCIGTSMKHVY